MAAPNDDVTFLAYRGNSAVIVSTTCLLAFSALPDWFKFIMVVGVAWMHVDFYKRHLKPLISRK